ncbi:transposase [Streptomyces sp. NBC_01604]|uniref:transposase n=1 Tax=Streptomyces sp. NBC_01604 TaxID=2975894 RepID=UPI0038630230
MKELTSRVSRGVRFHRPRLLDIVGVGPDGAAAPLIAAGDNPGAAGQRGVLRCSVRCQPLVQSSGKTPRRRLSRGGNRQANAVLYRIVVTRLRRGDTSSPWHPHARLPRTTHEAGHVETRDHPLPLDAT